MVGRSAGVRATLASCDRWIFKRLAMNWPSNGMMERKFCSAGEVAATLSVRRLQGRDGHHGESLQEPGEAAHAACFSVGAMECRGWLRDPAGLGRWPHVRNLFF